MKLTLLKLLYILWVGLISLCGGYALSLVTVWIFDFNLTVFASAFFIGMALGCWTCLREVIWKDLDK